MATPAQVIDLAPYQSDADVKAAASDVRTIADAAREIVIVDEETNNAALDLLSQARKGVRRIEALRKRWLTPLNDQVKLIRGDFEQLAAPAKEADQILAQKTSEYRIKIQEAARKEQARLQALAEKRQERAAARAEARGEEPPVAQPIVPTVAPPAKSVKTDGGAKVTFRKQTHFEVTDEAAVPRKYLCVDVKKLGAAVRAGIITAEDPIPGVRVWVTEEATVR